MNGHEDEKAQWQLKVLLRDEILEQTEGRLEQIVKTERVLRDLAATITREFGASHVTALQYEPRTQDYRIRYSCGTEKLPKDLIKVQESDGLITQRDYVNILSDGMDEKTRSSMRFYKSELEFLIHSHNHLDGILLVGPPGNGMHYESEAVTKISSLAGRFREALQEEIERQQASRDPQTSSYHYKFLYSSVALLAHQANQSSGPSALACVELNDLDELRHACGNTAVEHALQMASESIQERIRSSDSFITHGLSKFCILFSGMRNWKAGSSQDREELFITFVENLLRGVHDEIRNIPLIWGSKRINVTATIAAVLFTRSNDRLILEKDLEEQIKMLESKIAVLGKDHVGIFGLDTWVQYMDSI